MDYETRKRLIFNYLTAPPDGVLLRYKRPPHLSDDSARAEINDLAEDLNEAIPNAANKDQFLAILERFRKALRLMETNRNWPTIPQAIKAMKEAVKGTSFSKVAAIKPLSRAEIEARRIRNGEPTAEHWTRGYGAAELLARGLVTQEQLDAYKRPDL